ncbi:NADPH-dependent FMN reductase [Terribacillus saccharophilus]|uniref:NADPH-dependent FMN reductase n=1 Tax=Terribacillus saccharophilus TaxID=361277 RepID=UPI002DC9BDBC|nr:NADPH-dependent FMN reductase [Terribacillus saccharophilus]
MTKAVVITGSPKKTSRLNGPVDYVIADLELKGCDVTHVVVADLPAEDLLYANFTSDAIIHATQLVKDADVVVVATQVYKASYTGVLKCFLDLVPERGLAGKKVLPLAMGGTTAHLLMLEFALKPVLSVLGANAIEQGVFIQDKQVVRAVDNSFELGEDCKLRLDQAVGSLLEGVTIEQVV